MIQGTFKGIPDSWEFLIKKVWNDGKINKTEYGMKSKYVNGIAIDLTNMTYGWHKSDPWCSDKRVEVYKNQFKRGYTEARIAEAKNQRDKELMAFDYTYMDRMTKPVDQIAHIRDAIIKAGHGEIRSRRLQATTYRPELDMTSEHPPCLQNIFVYADAANGLEVGINYRSWDLWKGYPGNLNAILWMVEEEFVKPTNRKLERFWCFGNNCHIYEDDWQQVERFMRT